jgi:hypothetical protein
MPPLDRSIRPAASPDATGTQCCRAAAGGRQPRCIEPPTASGLAAPPLPAPRPPHRCSPPSTPSGRRRSPPSAQRADRRRGTRWPGGPAAPPARTRHSTGARGRQLGRSAVHRRSQEPMDTIWANSQPVKRVSIAELNPETDEETRPSAVADRPHPQPALFPRLARCRVPTMIHAVSALDRRTLAAVVVDGCLSPQALAVTIGDWRRHTLPGEPDRRCFPQQTQSADTNDGRRTRMMPAGAGGRRRQQASPAGGSDVRKSKNWAEHRSP